LTEDGLQLLGVRSIIGGMGKLAAKFTQFADCISDLLPLKSEPQQENISLMNQVMAACHSITYIGDELVGDPLEIRMFESTKWVLDEQSDNSSNDIVLAYVRPNGAKT
jgi:cation-transporting ATPase 13A3/4/5